MDFSEVAFNYMYKIRNCGRQTRFIVVFKYFKYKVIIITCIIIIYTPKDFL